jgi:hypothetical protein
MLPNGAPEFANLTEFLPPGARSALQGVRFMGTQINPTLQLGRHREACVHAGRAS